MEHPDIEKEIKEKVEELKAHSHPDAKYEQLVRGAKIALGLVSIQSVAVDEKQCGE